MNDYLLTLKPRHQRDYLRLLLAALSFIVGVVAFTLSVHANVDGRTVDCGTPLNHWFHGGGIEQSACGRVLSAHIVRASSFILIALLLCITPIFAPPLLRLGIVIVVVFAGANVLNATNHTGGVFEYFVAALLIATAVFLGRRLHIDD